MTLPAVKVINCDGTADASNVLAGLDWLSANVKFPAVASMSLGADTPNQALDDAVTALIQQGTLAVIAAGNYNQGGQSQMRLLQQVSRVTEYVWQVMEANTIQGCLTEPSLLFHEFWLRVTPCTGHDNLGNPLLPGRHQCSTNAVQVVT